MPVALHFKNTACCVYLSLILLLRLLFDLQLWADPLVWGFDHRAQDAAECCAACHAYNTAIERGGMAQGRNSTRCNTWAFCADKEACKERYRECW